jgi:hypothetical protein
MSWGVTQHLRQPCSRCHDDNYRYQLIVPSVRSPSPTHERTQSPPRSPSLGPSPGFPPAQDLYGDDELGSEPQFSLAVCSNEDVQMEDLPDPQLENSHGWVVDYYEGAGTIYGIGETFLSKFDQDQYAEHHIDNPHYPFADSNDWTLANFPLKSGLSMCAINEYLSLNLVSGSGTMLT